VYLGILEQPSQGIEKILDRLESLSSLHELGGDKFGASFFGKTDNGNWSLIKAALGRRSGERVGLPPAS
jgi:hypothetical protein